MAPDTTADFETFESAFDSLISKLLACNKKSVPDVIDTVNDIEQVYNKWVVREKGVASANHLEILRKPCTHFLVGVMNDYSFVAAAEDLAGDDGEENQDTVVSEADSLIDRITSLISHLSSLGGSAPLTREWSFHGDINLDIRELSFSQAGFGWQTWGSSIVMSHMISTGILPVKMQSIIELGCGTGLVGLVAAKCGATRVVLTDYLDEVIDNANFNAAANNLQNVAYSQKLDWCNPPDVSEIPPTEMVLAADVCYEVAQARLLPSIFKRFLKNTPSARAYVVLPERERFEAELECFETAMLESGFVMLERRRVFEDDGPSGAFDGPEKSFVYFVFAHASAADFHRSVSDGGGRGGGGRGRGGPRQSLTTKLEDDYIRNLQQQIYLLELETRYLRSSSREGGIPNEAQASGPIMNSGEPDLRVLPLTEAIKHLKMKYAELQDTHKREMQTLDERLQHSLIEIQTQKLSIQTLEKEKEDLKNRLRHAKDQSLSEKEKIYGECLSLRKKVEAAQTEMARFEQMHNRSQIEKQHVQSAAFAAQEEMNKMKQQIEEQIQINAQLRSRMNELYKENVKLQSDLESTKGTLHIYELENTKETVTTLQTELLSLRAQLKQLETAKSHEEHLRLRVVQDCSELVKSNVTLKAELEDMQRRLRKESEGREDRVKKRRDSLRDNEEVREELARVRDEVAMGRLSVEHKERRIGELVTQLKASEDALNKALEAQKVLEDRIKSLETRIKDQENEIIQVGQEKRLLMDDVAELRNTAELCAMKVTQLEQEKHNLHGELEKFQGEMASRR
ncbi:hypothetical protein HK102_001107 [Quaeritorhiza haematococci]|nr:hypothetical protein HK102_001107 [Quaeritorhiza haematococci]